MEPQSPSKTKLPFMGFLKCHQIVKICLLIMVIVLVLAVTFYVYGVKGKGKPYFTVVVDCGSTGTRVNVYEWGTNSVRNGNLPILLHLYPDNLTKNHLWSNGCQYHCMQTELGLDKFVGNTSGVRVSLEPLIRWVEGFVPHDRHGDTQILVLATAGLRRLQGEDARWVLNKVERVIKEHSFMWKRDWIRVLSGREEAYYGWVALNYKMGYLSNLLRLPTLGLLDLGGSSLQVVVEAERGREDSHLLVSKIGHFEHRLMAYSLPAFVLNKAFDRMVSMLIQVNLKGNEGVPHVRHPCLSSTFVGNYSCSSCSVSDSFVQLIGDPNSEKCKILTQAAAMNTTLEDWSVPRLDSGCRKDFNSYGKNVLKIAINTNPGVQYHALSGFFAIYNMLNLTKQT